MTTTIAGKPRTTTTPPKITPWRRFPADPADWFAPEQVAKATEYAKPVKVVNLVRAAVEIAVLVALIAFDVVPELLGSTTNWVLRLAGAVAIVQLADLVTGVGFSWWREMVYDKRWGFSTQTAKGFVSDLVKAVPLGLVINLILLVPLWALMRSTELWWIWGWVLLAFFSVVLGFLFPVVIAPIFNKYTPLDNEGLRDNLLGLAKQVDADIAEVLVEDSSKRDKRENAYVAGLGKTRRVVLFDTMLKREDRQIRSVVAHEIGHWKLHHIVRTLPLGIGLALLNFVVLKLVLEWDWAVEQAGVTSLADPAIYPLFALAFPLASTITRLANAWLSRAHERQADIFSLETTRDAEAFVEAFRSMSIDNLMDLAPSKWKQLTHSHPPVAERMAMGTAWGQANA